MISFPSLLFSETGPEQISLELCGVNFNKVLVANSSTEVETKAESFNKISSPQTNLLREFNDLMIFSNRHRKQILLK